MKDFKSLIFMDRFKGLFEKLGVDYDIMRKILQVKLTMDGRRVPTIINNSNNNKKARKESSNSFLASLWVYVLLGLIMIPFVVSGKNYVFQMSLVFGMIMFMILTTLISDFSTVLLDIRDKNIISSKPVTNKTLSFAKAIHVLIYMFFITISISGPALVASLVKNGFLFFLVFLLDVILLDLFMIALTSLLYILILKFFDGEKLKDIINYVQIILSLTITIGYQLIGRLFDIGSINVTFSPKWWQYFIMPIWFSSPFEIIFKGSTNIYFIIFSILGLVVPILSIMLYIKLTPVFEKNLQKLSNNYSTSKKSNTKLSDKLSKVICRKREEKIFFRFASDMMRNEREFKLKVYPSLGFSIIFPFIFILNQLRDDSFSRIAAGKAYLNIYFCALMLPTIIMMMKYSSKYKGAFIYKSIPIKDVSSIFKGTIKAFIMRLIIPVYIFECIIFVFIFGFRILPDLVVVLLSIMLFTVLCFRLMKKSLPFSQAYGVSEQSEGLIVIPLMIMLGILAGIHFLCTFATFGIYVYMLVLVLVNILLWKRAFNIPWNSLNM